MGRHWQCCSPERLFSGSSQDRVINPHTSGLITRSFISIVLSIHIPFNLERDFTNATNDMTSKLIAKFALNVLLWPWKVPPMNRSLVVPTSKQGYRIDCRQSIVERKLHIVWAILIPGRMKREISGMCLNIQKSMQGLLEGIVEITSKECTSLDSLDLYWHSLWRKSKGKTHSWFSSITIKLLQYILGLGSMC